MTYKILYDYGAYEGNVIDNAEYDTIDEAIRAAVDKNYCTKFRIITIAWEPGPPTPPDTTEHADAT